MNFISIFASSGDPCTFGGTAFLTLPYWYQYLQGTLDDNGICRPGIHHLSDFWLVVLALIEMMLQVVVIIAIAMVVYGGVQLMTSQGQPDKVGKARSTIINALIGLAISIAAASSVAFIAGRFS